MGLERLLPPTLRTLATDPNGLSDPIPETGGRETPTWPRHRPFGIPTGWMPDPGLREKAITNLVPWDKPGHPRREDPPRHWPFWAQWTVRLLIGVPPHACSLLREPVDPPEGMSPP